MPSAADISATVTRQPEKPNHYTYLKSFRTEQCKDFLNHRCNQHRPFTCFFWHFPNQRRRRPVLSSKDGTFNYSPDIYCTTYDESTGSCPQGDSCPYLHRNIGDTEKRYHLRYYKTERCIIDTENKGSCTKNGPHCAFAHGPDDLRAPVFDINERNGPIAKSTEQQVDMEINGEKEKAATIDAVWYDENYIKLYYKTEPCLRTSRHVTLSCPFYHNARDRRRQHDVYKYRAVVCPNVKHKEEWTDPGECDLGDNCPYIHTRTEQQYHPDIYKTDKCHEEAANGRCSKGIFCAFAHDHIALPPTSPARTVSSIAEGLMTNASQTKVTSTEPSTSKSKNPANGTAAGQIISNGVAMAGLSSSINSDIDTKWLGFSSLKLDSRTNDSDLQSRMKQIPPPSSEVNPFYDASKRPEYRSTYGGTQFSNPTSKSASSMMPLNTYHPGVGNVELSFKAGSALPPSSESHLLDRLDSLEDDNEHSLLSISSSGMTTAPQLSLFNSAPVGGTPSLFSSFTSTMGLEGTTTGLNSSLNMGGYSHSMAGFPSTNGGYGLNPASRLTMYGLSLQPSEVEKVRTELAEAKEIIKRLTDEKLQAIKEREMLFQHHQAAALSESQALTNGGSYLCCLMPAANLESLTFPYLQEIQAQLQRDLRRLQMVMVRKAGGKCLGCLEQIATTLLPCKHKSLCEPCLLVAKNCPLCGASIPDQQQF